LFLLLQRPVERDQKQQPERAGEISEYAHRKMDPADASQTPREQHQSMLQISLAPAPVAPGVGDDVLRRFLVAPFKVIREPYLPVFPEQQSRLDEIVAE